MIRSPRSLALLAPLLLLAAPTHAGETCSSAAEIALAGPGTPGGNASVPRLGVDGSPVIGLSFSFELSGARAGAAGLLAVGLTELSLPLPGYGVTFVPGPPLFFLPLTVNGDGTATDILAVDATPQLCGLDVFAQVGILDPLATGGIAFSNARRVTLGDWADAEGRFPRERHPTRNAPFRIDLVDFDGNGALDVYAAFEGWDVLENDFIGGFVAHENEGGGALTQGEVVLPFRMYSSAALGDFTGNGHLDSVVSSVLGLVVYPGGGGFFWGNEDSSQGSYDVVGLAPGHFDADDDLDVIGIQAATAHVFPGKGDGTFKVPSSSFDIGAGFFRASHVVHLDGDDHADVVIANGDVSAHFGNGDGTFGSEVILPSSGTVYAIDSADLDGDGTADLVLGGTEGVSALLNDGAGSFTLAPVPASAPDIVLGVVVGDLDEDGTPDLVCTGYDPGFATQAHAFLGLGDGSFSFVTAFQSSGAAPALGDIDQDSHLDLVTGGTGGFGVVYGAGDGTFGASPPTTVVGERLFDAVASDFDGDGEVDLAVTYDPLDVPVTFLGNGDGTFTFGAPLPVPASAELLIEVGHLDDDDVPDLVVTRSFGLGEVALLRGNGDGTFTSFGSYDGPAFREFTLVDLNGDGLDDVAGDTTGDTLAVALNQGDGELVLDEEYFFGDVIVEVKTLDVDGDGDLDLAAARYTASTRVSVRLGKGDGTFSSLKTYTADQLHTGVGAMGVGDLDLDGHDDVVLGTGDPYLRAFFGQPDGSLVNAGFLESGFLASLAIEIEDMTGDGIPEIVTANGRYFCDRTLVHEGQFDSAEHGLPVRPRSFGPGGARLVRSIPADVDHDGVMDLIQVGDSITVLFGTP